MADSDTIPSIDDRLAKAEAAIAALKDDYKSQLRIDVDLLSSHWAAIDHDRPDATVMDELFSVAHNIKGQAGSFGYELVTSVAASLCALLREDRLNTAKMPATAQHVTILEGIVEKDVTGSGGATGDKIIQKLQSLVAQF